MFAVENPIFVVALVLVIIFEIGYIILDSKEHFKYFRDFMDAIILLTFILCIYFVYGYLRARRQAPKRGGPPISELAAQRKSKLQTDSEVDKLVQSEAYKKFEEEKLKRLKETGSNIAPQKDEDDADFLEELEEKETQIFDQ